MNQDIHVKIRSFDCSVLEKCVRKFVDELKQFGAKLVGPSPLPRKGSKFIVNRSPHVDKKSREQFEKRVSMRLIVVRDATPTIMQMLTGFFFPFGVGVDLKVKEGKKGKKGKEGKGGKVG
ncbi:30S ribosomal protein S10 [Wolbachia endosymbiont of Ctenocephalides felis wCfeT]|uniref:30S ribosomal protein S10 n=1 Tax=Wolbachia endosymbiont of Ctenocephalides felis wCfeT TaxID=2732593 RepID=UPI001447B474|nr:30S ribosomal protein S10 [Wolbachia endosymbiont of Ctenocephalides felis wCfeT]